jgi:hypothetical protein
MKERPIIFSAPMVRAILEGTKTQTRRVVKPQPPEILPAYAPKVYWPARDRHMTHGDPDGAAYLQFERPGDYDGAHVMRGGFGFRCPYGQPGDRLWVREAWQAFFDDEVQADRPRGPRHTMGQPARPDRKSFVFYKADGPGPVHPDGFQALWKSPLHLPRKYSRITLEVTAVRVERLQDISEADALAEGVTPKWEPGCSGRLMEALGGFSFRPAASAYAELWEQINGPGSWDANPWVWVIEFKRVTP